MATLKALPDQSLEVTVECVHRDAAHRDVIALVTAPLGQGDIERRRRRNGVVEEHLVEVPHAEEKQGVGIGVLVLEILHHHRRRGAGEVLTAGSDIVAENSMRPED